MREFQTYNSADINSMYASLLDIKSIERVNEKYRMRVLNKKYWPHHITVTPLKIADAERWCYDNFKSSQWRSVGTYFAFKSGADATMFTLRWA